MYAHQEKLNLIVRLSFILFIAQCAFLSPMYTFNSVDNIMRPLQYIDHVDVDVQ